MKSQTENKTSPALNPLKSARITMRYMSGTWHRQLPVEKDAVQRIKKCRKPNEKGQPGFTVWQEDSTEIRGLSKKPACRTAGFYIMALVSIL